MPAWAWSAVDSPVKPSTPTSAWNHFKFSSSPFSFEQTSVLSRTSPKASAFNFNIHSKCLNACLMTISRCVSTATLISVMRANIFTRAMHLPLRLRAKSVRRAIPTSPITMKTFAATNTKTISNGPHQQAGLASCRRPCLQKHERKLQSHV